MADRNETFQGREDAIRYLALNASAQLEDIWAYDDTLWKNAPCRPIEFEDMVAKQKADLLQMDSSQSSFRERDFDCYSEDEIRVFAFDVRKLFLTDREKHLAICARCQNCLEYWSGLIETFERAAPGHTGRADA